MSYPDDLRYTSDHEWVRMDGNIATIGITHFAQSELGDIVYIDINTVGEELNANDIFGTVEAVKTVSDLFLPLAGKVLEVNPSLNDKPELVNTDPYGEGWMIKLEVSDSSGVEGLMDSAAYEASL